MMRIVCPVCGEEPKKGERHVCPPPAVASPQALPAPAIDCTFDSMGSCSGGGAGVANFGGLQRRGMAPTPGAVCASIASLVSKSPTLWKSGKALVRCGGEEFVAGLLASAVGCGVWHKDPKQAMVVALTRRVQDDAARALQDAWRSCLAARRQPRPLVERGPGGYLKLTLPSSQRGDAKPSAAPVTTSKATATGSTAAVVGQRPSSAERVCKRLSPSRSAAVNGPVANPAESAPVPTKYTPVPPPCGPLLPSPRNRSNPRPGGARAVPFNPIQAMKQRKLQQQQEIEERKFRSLQEAEEQRLARTAGASTGTPASSIPSSPQGSTGGPSVFGEIAKAVAARPPTMPTQPAGQSIDNAMHIPDGPDAGSMDTVAAIVPASDACDWAEGGALVPAEASMPTPLERRMQRQAQSEPSTLTSSRGPPSPRSTEPATAATGSWTPRSCSKDEGARCGGNANASCSPSTSATERLRERMRQREQKGGDQTPRSCATTSTSTGWQARIEARQREAETQEVLEAEERQRITERSSRRNDAMRRVVERQAERQQDVAVLST